MDISQHQKPIETDLGPVPEPTEILANIDLGGKTALVTGGYSGIGLETVRALATAGAHVHVPARDVARAQKALEGIIDPSHVDFMDLSDLPSIAAYGEKLAGQHRIIDIAIFNAGVMACPLQRTAQGVEWQIGVNHLGHFALLKEILPALRAAQGARLVTLSSIGHRMAASLPVESMFRAAGVPAGRYTVDTVERDYAESLEVSDSVSVSDAF